jgi:hypothetical protein
VSGIKIQTIPTTIVTGYWDPGSVSEIPENVKIVMSNGKRANYRLTIEQPRPQLRKDLDKFTKLCVGYERKDKE